MNGPRLALGLAGILGILALGGLSLGGASAAPVHLPGGGAPVASSCLGTTSLIVTPSVATVGRPIQVITVTSAGAPSGCVGPVTFSYTGLPPGCFSQPVRAFACVPSTAGAFAVTVTVHAGMAVAVAHTAFIVL